MTDGTPPTSEVSPSERTLPGGVRISASGEAQIIIYGDVVGGDKIVHLDSSHTLGDKVERAVRRPVVTRRPAPVTIRPRPFQELLNRETEQSTTIETLQAREPVGFHSEPGVGKTVLLRQLAHAKVSTEFPDGVIYLRARGLATPDLLQSLFDTFYMADQAVKPDTSEIARRLQPIQALVILDDLDIEREGVDTLLNAAPQCGFLLASQARLLWGEGRAIPLLGLATKEALVLIERELGRELSADERPHGEALIRLLDGHPLRILQAAALAREEGRTLVEVAEKLKSESFVGELPAALDDADEKILAALAALDGAALDTEHIAELTDVPNAAQVLERLAKRHLVQAQSPRYRLTGDLAAQLDEIWHLTEWRNRAVDYFLRWTTGRAPALLLQESEALLRTTEWAAEVGRRSEALHLARRLQHALALGRQWSAWAQLLELALKTARSLGDQAAEAWALHQLGTRALCLGETSAARSALQAALRLRQALGDRAGAAVTRQNLNLLPGAPPTGCRRILNRWVIGGSVVVLGVGAILVAFLGILLFRQDNDPVIEGPPVLEVVENVAATPTNTFTPSATPSFTPTRTPTPTEGPDPILNVFLGDGCDTSYLAGDATTLHFIATEDGEVEIWEFALPADPRLIVTTDVIANEVFNVRFSIQLPAGEHTIEAQLVGTGIFASCSFTVEEPPTSTPTFTRTPLPVVITLEPLADAHIDWSCQECNTGKARQLQIGGYPSSEFPVEYWSLISLTFTSAKDKECRVKRSVHHD